MSFTPVKINEQKAQPTKSDVDFQRFIHPSEPAGRKLKKLNSVEVNILIGEKEMNWEDPLDPVCVTVSEIVNGERTVLIVYHEEGHGGWSLMDGFDTAGRKPEVIPKEVILAIDPSLEEITSLPVGFRAKRTAAGADWIVEKL